MNLVIVESPTKSKTISKFLGPDYRVLSSYGHIRDLPEDKIGIDIENNFKPEYIIPQKSKKIVQDLKKNVKNSNKVILASDEDREGEAIAWHLIQALDLNKYERIVFHEITKKAIEEALKNPRDIDLNLVDSQQARRILDRLVGYELSPFLWKKVARGLSAGRVQSVAVRLVVDRENEIKNFKPQEYWNITALLRKADEFEAILVKKGGKILDKLEIKNQNEANAILNDLKNAEYKIINIEKKRLKEILFLLLQPAPYSKRPGKTHFPAKFTMSIAQKLYETGKITYHRTDSFNLSDIALFSAKKFIIGNYGEKYWPGFSRKYKAKAKAQEAHEAIRPTSPNLSPESEKLEKNQSKLYDLIWRRFIACQMSQARFDSTKVEIEAKNYGFQAIGSTLKFDGFLKVYPMKFKENELPALELNEILELLKLLASQHFTQPPPRYNEASLIKALEENGIGRPSTYAPILSTIQERNYIEKDENRRFRPTEIGEVVNSILVKHFSEIVDIGFTAKMEEDLDGVSQNEKEWVPVIKDFYSSFHANLEKKYKEVSKKEFTAQPTENKCEKCGSPLLIRLGKFGKFYACSKFPKCRYTASLEKNNLEIACPKCQKGKIVEKRTKKRKIFYGCSNWPKCDFALWDKPTGEKCPKCVSLLVQTKRGQIKCSNKECYFKQEKK